MNITGFSSFLVLKKRFKKRNCKVRRKFKCDCKHVNQQNAIIIYQRNTVQEQEIKLEHTPLVQQVS